MSKYQSLWESLPPHLRRELVSVAQSRVGGLDSYSELHLTVGQRSSAVSSAERIYFTSPLTDSDMQRTVSLLCDGSIYAHRDTIAEGYISLCDGVRVGICGQARYENGRLVGVSDVTSLVFRIPTASSSLEDELCEAWRGTSSGMLIYSAPGGGKTTALRTLVPHIAAEERVRVAVVDERCEFSAEECRRYGVMLMRGYKRADGMEIALRTMSPDVLVVDEIGSRGESDAMLESLNSGVRLLATAHASDSSALQRRGGVRPFIDNMIFDTYFGIFHTDGTYSAKIERTRC